MKTVWMLLLVLATSLAGAAERSLVKLIDPSGDDDGDGTLVYPVSGDIKRGSLDLRGLDISRDENGFWFTATFGDFIREMWWAPGGGKNVSARNKTNRLPFGFNLDIYVDTDRKPGSGHLFTLPGRKARIDRRYAWEKAIIISPQPQTARKQLLAKLRENFPNRPVGEAEASIDSTMLFVTRRTISDRSISFFVPKEFMGNSDGTDWAVTAFVTLAAPVESDGNLGVRQFAKEAMPDNLSYSGDKAPPLPIVDLLLPSGEMQTRILSTGRPLVGYSWGKHAIDEVEIDESVQTFTARLLDLKDQREQGLISDAEYAAQRAKILGEL